MVLALISFPSGVAECPVATQERQAEGQVGKQEHAYSLDARGLPEERHEPEARAEAVFGISG